MRRKLFAAAVAPGVLAIVLFAGTASAGGRNLKYFPKDISGEDLTAAMKLMKNSLGVQCNHCHVVIPTKKFDVDTPKKSAARDMLKMVDKINKDHFKWQDAPKATCYMCHRGHEKPELKPEKAELEAKFTKACEDPKKAAMVKTMKELVEKLNKKVFTWKDAPKATCWLCHRGEAEPKLKLPDE